MPKKISTKCNVFCSTYNIASASVFYPSRPQKKSATPSTFYTFENPQVRRAANLHFTGGLLGKPVSDCMFAVIKMELSGKSVYGPVLKTTQLSAHAQNHASPGRKLGQLCPFGGGGFVSPSNTMWPGPRARPTCMPSFILIRQTVWPKYTNVVTDRTDRTDRQRSDSIGRTVSQTVAQKHWPAYMAGRIGLRCIGVYGRNADALTSVTP